MRKQELVEDWLRRATSNLARAKQGRVSKAVLYEDLCFDCQQAVEKILKALLVERDVLFPRTHSIGRLLELVETNGIQVPDNIKKAVILTDYAVMARYPGSYRTINHTEYQYALTLSETVFNWAHTQIKME